MRDKELHEMIIEGEQKIKRLNDMLGKKNIKHEKLWVFNTKKAWIAVTIWFFISIILGMVFEYQLNFEFIHNNYSTYLKMIDQKNIFSSVIFCMLTIAPIFAVYHYKECIIKITLYKKELKKIWLATFIGVMGGVFFNTKLASFNSGSKFTKLFLFIIDIGGWFGAFIVCFFGLYMAIFVITTLMKYIFEGETL